MRKPMLPGMVWGLLIAVSVTGSTESAQAKTGSIKSITTETERLSGQAGARVAAPRARAHEESYDLKGARTRWARYQPGGTLQTQESITVDTTGAKRLNGAAFNLDGALQNRWGCTYNQDGTQFGECTGYDATGALMWKDRYTYDANGARTGETRYSPTGAVLSEALHTSDGVGGKTIAGTRYHEDGTVNARWLQRFDAKGNLLESKSSTADSTLMEKTLLSYTAGALESVVSYDSSGSPKSKTLYSYDHHGDKIQEEQFTFQSDGTIGTRSVRVFDQYGEISEMRSYDGEGKLIAQLSFSYELDGVGNWVKKITSGCTMDLTPSSNGKHPLDPCEVTYRTITYY